MPVPQQNNAENRSEAVARGCVVVVSFGSGMAILAMTAHGQDARATTENAENQARQYAGAASGVIRKWHGHPGHDRTRARCPCHNEQCREPKRGGVSRAGALVVVSFGSGMAILAMTAHGQDARATTNNTITRWLTVRAAEPPIPRVFQLEVEAALRRHLAR